MANDAAAATDEGSTSSLSLYSPVYSKLGHQIHPANSPANNLQPQYHSYQPPMDHIPRSHEWHRHPYWAVESIRQAMSLTAGAGAQSPSTTHSQLRTPSLMSDTLAAAAAAGVVANGNSEMRDQATNTDITSSECKSQQCNVTSSQSEYTFCRQLKTAWLFKKSLPDVIILILTAS